MASRVLLATAVVAGCAVCLSGAANQIVGVEWNPNINYTLWSSNQTFHVDDLISFRYQKGTHNVYEVSEAGFLLTEPRRYFFVCGNGGCQAGMRVGITVYPTPDNATRTNCTNEFDHGPEIVPDCSPDCGTAAAASLTADAKWLTVAALAVAIAAVA